jgi:hypothetical protein
MSEPLMLLESLLLLGPLVLLTLLWLSPSQGT